MGLLEKQNHIGVYAMYSILKTVLLKKKKKIDCSGLQLIALWCVFLTLPSYTAAVYETEVSRLLPTQLTLEPTGSRARRYISIFACAPRKTSVSSIDETRLSLIFMKTRPDAPLLSAYVK